MPSATITFRVSKEMKESCKEVLAQNGMSVSEYCKFCMEYLMETGRPAVKQSIEADDDSDLEEIAKYRLENPEEIVMMDLDNL